MTGATQSPTRAGPLPCSLRQGHDKTLDMWALGCFLYELFCGRTPFRGKDSKKTVANIVDSKK